MPVSLKTVSALFGGTAPHSLLDLSGALFDGGGTYHNGFVLGGSAPYPGDSWHPGNSVLIYDEITPAGRPGWPPSFDPDLPLSLNVFDGKSPATYTYGTYSSVSAGLVPPVMTSTSQSSYTISGHAGNTDLTNAFNRSPTTNYSGTDATRIDLVTYQGSATNWPGVGSILGAWVRVDLPASISIKGIVIRSETYTNIPKNVRLLGSNDGSNWDLVFTTDDTLYAPGTLDYDFYLNRSAMDDNMDPIVLLFTSSTAAYSKDAFTWLRVSHAGTYLPRLAQFNLIPD